MKKEVITLLKSLTILFIPTIIISIIFHAPTSSVIDNDYQSDCSMTCNIQVVQTIPEQLVYWNNFTGIHTHDAWMDLIRNTQSELLIAAYKSSLQKKHVLHDVEITSQQQGEDIFRAILDAGTKQNVQIKMIENYAPKDRGDNIDGKILENHNAIQRKSLDFQKLLGRGKMHSKFLISDKKHAYIGSANLDWRSLNQKLEIGVLIRNCDCLVKDLEGIFETYWNLPSLQLTTETRYNMQNPLKIKINEEESEIYVATSPKTLMDAKRTWDLDAIVASINNATTTLDIHVMDYFPVFIYKKPSEYFPAIDNAIRNAIVRKVKIRILTSALHYPEIGVRYMKSLQSLDGVSNYNIQIRIITIPRTHLNVLLSRERRSHIKFLVTEGSVVIGTSNWSGDYFTGGTTGEAIVVHQNGSKRHLVRQMKEIFDRDWYGPYSHNLEDYYENCVLKRTAMFCEVEKN